MVPEIGFRLHVRVNGGTPRRFSKWFKPGTQGVSSTTSSLTRDLHVATEISKGKAAYGT
jgi:hypothetical protein